MTLRLRVLAAVAVACSLCISAPAGAQQKAAKPPTNPADEPVASKFSLARSAAFLDQTSLAWTRERKCGSCHTNYPYLLSSVSLKGEPTAAFKEVLGFFEDRAANWDKAKPRWDTEVIATASFLALTDASAGGKPRPVTRQALDRMWKLQRPDGAWNWLKCDWPPLEHDDYYGALVAALGVGAAGQEYAQSDTARVGVAKLRTYFNKTPPPDLHHRTWLLWASVHLDGLLTADDREAVVKKLFAAQRPDGGWCLPSLGAWKRHNGKPNDPDAPSDGYATGLVVYVLRQAGVPADDKRLRRGVDWLRANQRQSGWWFTRSLNNDQHHYMTHTGTAFAVMALRACGVED